jgi:septal ring factor EnvC (AmiA/AmiB activator)
MPRRLLRLSGRSRLLRCLAAAAALGLAVPATAQQTGAIPDTREASRAEFEQISRELVLSDEKVARLAADIATLRKDYATITAALIQSAKTEKKLNEDIETISERLARQKDQEEAIRRSLWARRDVLAEVLGGLERMGLNPPPAILVTPQDALSSVRSAILLGAVVPGLREETDALRRIVMLGDTVATQSSGRRNCFRNFVTAWLPQSAAIDGACSMRGRSDLTGNS